MKFQALRPDLERARATLRLAAQAALWHREPPPPRTVGRALYVASWARAHLTAFWAWLAGKSRSRRWAPGTGEEWKVLRAAASYMAGHHILRVLVDGLPCIGCGALARYGSRS